jgi:NADH:ubiquinone oxidoreductase subunit 5 (subunit L)/multisubunit Na+/H+ antiporter MnhA subunit
MQGAFFVQGEQSMKYCPKCGTELADESAYCSKCGAWQYVEAQPGASYQQANQNPPQQKPPYNKAVATVNKVLLIIMCAVLCLILVFAIVCTAFSIAWFDEFESEFNKPSGELEDPRAVFWMFCTIYAVYMWIAGIRLAWCLPMTLHYIKKNKANVPTSMAFKICTLIFVNLLVGVLMLCCEQNADSSTNNNGGTI